LREAPVTGGTVMPEELKAVYKKDLASRAATDAEQAIINERIVNGEPAFEEEREGYTPPKKEVPEGEAKKAELEELGLAEDASDEDIAAKREERDSAKADETKAKAVELGLPEDATAEEIEAKEAEKGGGEEDVQKAFDKADAMGKGDLITELELELETEADEGRKKDLQETLDKWNKTIANPEIKPEEEVDFETEIANYAKEKEISKEEAKEVIEGRNVVSKKYGDNPKKLAHALRSIQVEYTKEKQAHVDTAKALEQASFTTMMNSKIKPEEILKKPDGTRLTRDECIEAYRESYPDLTDDKEDGEVYDLQRQHVLRHMNYLQKESQSKVKADAKSKRVELMSNLPKDAEPYKDSIKKMLDSFPDNAVAQERFDLEEIVLLHKGKDVDNLVSEAEKRGFKRGLERKRIVGEIKTPSGKPKTNKDVDNKSFNLNDTEKQEALEFFADNNISESRKYELYADIVKSNKELKDKKDKK